jgi:N-acetylmuramoyl-L-alanine amidase
MTFHRVLESIFTYLVVVSLSVGVLRADEKNSWEIKEIDGDKYVSVEQIQKYYRFDKLTRNESFISLENNKISMNLEIGSPECHLNGIKIIFSNPVAETGNAAYVSSWDLAGFLDPMLRPSKIVPTGNFRTVILDPAHGGKDPGLRNEFGTESEFTFKIANLTKEQLEAKGFTVVLTRKEGEDASPEERLNLANLVEESAVFVSISFDSGPPSENGLQTLAVVRGEDVIASDPFGWASVALSTSIHGAMISKLGRNTSDRGIKRGELGVFSRIKHPAVLVKPGFMTHPRESRMITILLYQNTVAKGIVEGIEKYGIAVTRRPQAKSEDAPDLE